MKALTIRQPWAWAILQGGKGVENRSWPTKYRGPLLIHAGVSRQSLSIETPDDWQKRYGVRFRPEDLAFGTVLGVVDLVDCVPVELVDPANPWATGAWCWILENPRPVAVPYALKGRLGLFDVACQLEQTV
jgi:hypothetical protein